MKRLKKHLEGLEEKMPSELQDCDTAGGRAYALFFNRQFPQQGFYVANVVTGSVVGRAAVDAAPRSTTESLTQLATQTL